MSIFNILRLRFVEGEPFSLEQVWLPVERAPGLDAARLDGQSLYALLRGDYEVRLSYARQTVEPVLSSEFESRMLELKAETPVLLFCRVAYDTRGVPVEYSKCVYRGVRFKYEMAFHV